MRAQTVRLAIWTVLAILVTLILVMRQGKGGLYGTGFRIALCDFPASYTSVSTAEHV